MLLSLLKRNLFLYFPYFNECIRVAILRLCSHYDSFSCRHKKLSGTVWTVWQRLRTGASRSHTSKIVPRWFGELNPSPHTWKFYFRLSGFQSLLLLLHHGPSTYSLGTKMWYRTYPICNAQPLRSEIGVTQLRNVTEIRAKIVEGHLLAG